MFRRSRHTKRVRSNKRTESRAFRREYNSIRWQEARNIRPLFFMVFRNNKRMNEGQLKLLAENRDILAKTVDKVKARNPTVKDGPEREKKQKLLGLINEVLNNVSSISDPDFSLQKLAEAVGSNTKYVSQVINEYYNKNFKTLLNEYRLREATRQLHTSFQTDVWNHSFGISKKSGREKAGGQIIGIRSASEPACLSWNKIQLPNYFIDGIGHFFIMRLHALVESHLILGPGKIVCRIFHLPVFVTVEIIPKETHALHKGEEGHGKR